MSSKVNEVNGENLQDPPIENPVYANGTHQLLRNFQLRHTVEAPPGIWPAKDKTERRYTIQLQTFRYLKASQIFLSLKFKHIDGEVR